MNGNLAGIGFNPDQMEAPEDRFEVIPAGWYAAIIKESDFGPNKAGTGNNLKLVHEITGPTQAGRLYFTHLALDNPNPEAVRIAGENLYKICAALGHQGQLLDSTLLHDKPMLINLGIKKNRQTGEQENTIKQWKPYDPAQLTAAPAPAATAPRTPATPAGTPAMGQVPPPADSPPFATAPPPGGITDADVPF